jgi:hypothetical protein
VARALARVAGDPQAAIDEETTMETSISLKTAVEQYVQHQTEVGQKPSTIGTIKRSMELLVGDLGEDKEVGKILAVHIAGFFKSEAATMQAGKDGAKPRANASVLQIRRIVRAALVWWHQQGYLKAVPLPADEKKYLEPRKGRKPKATEPAEPAQEAATESEPQPATDAATEQPAE